jgi:aryl-alcohol dehydrogenase-like predicted oxidoreductase
MIPSFRSPDGTTCWPPESCYPPNAYLCQPGKRGRQGGLTGRITPDSRFPDGDFRNSYFGGDRKAQVKRHVDALTADLGIEPDQVAEIALRYVLSQDAVSTVIAGMRTVRNVERNVAVGDGRGLSAERQAIVAKHRWERNFYES